MNRIKALFPVVAVLLGLVLSPVAHAGVEITYLHNDALGSAVAGTDEQGNVKWRSQYRPYGEERLGERQLFGVRAGYTGHRDDPETGLTYMGARYYSPAIGRFMGVDPVGVDESNIHSFNRYAYANNNPYKYIDPDGQESREAMFELLGMQDPGAGVANRARQIADGAAAFGDAVDSAATDPTNAIPGSAPLKILGAGVLGTKFTKLGKKAKDSAKNEKHGDQGRALSKAENQIQELENSLEQATGREKKQLQQKIKNIRQTAQRKAKGEEHSKRFK